MNANDKLSHCTGSENIYKHPFGLYYTDGVKELCSTFECYWLLDIIVSYQPYLTQEGFQSWRLTRNPDHSAVIICTDGNKNELQRQEVILTDFEPTEVTIWVCDSVALLPSEY